MEIKQTPRGFDIAHFVDQKENKCSIQKSSLATQDCIWLGCDEIDLKLFDDHGGWVDIPTTENHIANTRMHLNREQVRELLPLLQYFADTGDLPRGDVSK